MSHKGTIASNCAKDRPLTGKASCDRVEGLTSGIIITDSNALYPIDSAKFIEGMEGWVHHSGIMRMMPLKDIINDAPAGGEVNVSQVGYGPNKPTGLSAANSVFQIDSGLCQYKELSRANKNPYRVFRVDKQGYIYGTVVTRDGVDYFAGFNAYLYSYTTKDTDLTNAGGVFLGVYWGANYENEMKNINAFEVGDIPEGLLGAYLVKGANAGQATVHTSCSSTNITDAHEWDTAHFLNDANTNPTNVVYDQTTNVLTFTPAGIYHVAPADVLHKNGIVGIEGINQPVTL